jgi:hypothetical protein
MSLALRRLLAWSAIVAFTGTFGLGAGSLGHAGPDDDAACRQEAPSGGPAHAEFSPAATVPVPTHCAFCHWQRMVSGASTVAVNLSAASLDPIAVVVALTTRAIGSAAVDERPSRAPPV